MDNVSGMDIKIHKPPSDTLLCTPAVNKVNQKNWPNLEGSPLPTNNNKNFADSFGLNVSERTGALVHPMFTDNRNTNIGKYTSDTINDTLSQLCLFSDAKRRESTTTDPFRNSTLNQMPAEEERLQKQQIDSARRAAKNTILEAERFKACVQQPNRGREISFNNYSPNKPKCQENEIKAMRYLDSEDDEFFSYNMSY